MAFELVIFIVVFIGVLFSPAYIIWVNKQNKSLKKKLNDYFFRPIVSIGGIASFIFFLYHSFNIDANHRAHVDFVLYGLAVGSLFFTIFLTHLAGVFSDEGISSAVLGCYEYSSDLQFTGTGQKWKEHYLVSVINVRRPKRGIQKMDWHCAGCRSSVPIQIVSFCRTLRNKIIVITAYSTCWGLVLKLISAYSGVGEIPAWLEPVSTIIGLIMVFISVGFIVFILSSEIGTINGIGINKRFAKSKLAKTPHRLFHASDLISSD